MLEIFVKTFNLLLYQPLFNFLILLYNYLPGHDFGLAIIILTLFIRLVLYPSSAKTIKNQKILNELQPKLQEIQKKHKNDKEKQVKETLALYKQAKINPFGSLLPTLIQLPLLIALFLVFRKGLNPSELVNLYGFVPNPGQINPYFLGRINLLRPNIYLAILAGIFQFIQTKTMTTVQPKITDKKSDFAKIMQKQMVYFFPFLTVLILINLPSALGLYWIAGSIFLITEQYFLKRKQKTLT